MNTLAVLFGRIRRVLKGEGAGSREYRGSGNAGGGGVRAAQAGRPAAGPNQNQKIVLNQYEKGLRISNNCCIFLYQVTFKRQKARDFCCDFNETFFCFGLILSSLDTEESDGRQMQQG